MREGEPTVVRKIEDWLAREIAAAGGARVLVLGAPAAPPGAGNEAPVLRLGMPRNPEDLPTAEGRFDLVLVAGVFEHLARDAADAVLATLRDRCARRLRIALPVAHAARAATVPWTADDVRALGFETLERVRARDAEYVIYGFDIDRYKHTPAWFGPRDWANPQMWDRSRW